VLSVDATRQFVLNRRGVTPLPAGHADGDVLTKDLLRVTRRGGGYRPVFAERADRPLAARVVGTFQGHVDATRGDLDAALRDLEGDAAEFKLVRGLAKCCEREATFVTRAPVTPASARRAAFVAAEELDGVVAPAERERALARAADSLAVPTEDVDASLFADLEDRQVLASFDAPWDPDGLLAQYNLSLAQTALFDATEVRVRSADPKALVSAVKRLRLMYEIERTDDGRRVVVTGPDALFSRSRRYGTRFARLLRTVAKATEWRLEATVDDHGTERELVLSDDGPVRVPDAPPVADVEYDSGVEAEFAARFQGLNLDWVLSREPEPLATGHRVMIPDFAFDYAPGGDPSAGPEFRVFFEVMGFWTPEYVQKKLSQLADVEAVEMVVAVDESLGVGEAVAATDAAVVPYTGSVRVKDVVDVLRDYEADLVADAVASLSAKLAPDDDVVTLEAVADHHGVSEEALDDVSFPAHERVGRTLVRPAVLDAVADDLAAGMAYADAEAVLDQHGIDDASAALSALGYRVEWTGLSGGTVREK
jgi:predicted nuclease of restriction endonuclease-like RecB superfamily